MDPEFAALLDRIQFGDQTAATELVRLYEPVIRREIRLWLRQCRTVPLDRVLDSTDICQSVMARFFEAVDGDRINLESREHLENLLLLMARNRFRQHLRNNQTRRRDARRDISLVGTDVPEPASRSTPMDHSVEHELLEMIRERLSPEERELAARRAGGESWEEIVRAMGGTIDARRMQLTRAEARVAADFGLRNQEQKA